MGYGQLFQFPQAPVPRLVTELLGVDEGVVERLGKVRDDDDLSELCNNDPLQFYVYFRVGSFCLDSPLAEPVFDYLERTANLSSEQRQTMHAQMLRGTRAVSDTLQTVLAGILDEFESVQWRLEEVEEAFRSQADTLLHPLVDFQEKQPAEADEPVLALTLSETQLQLMRLAVLLPPVLAARAESPLLLAAARLSELQPVSRVLALRRRLYEHEPDVTIALSLKEVLTLMQAVQACAALLLSDALPAVFADENSPHSLGKVSAQFKAFFTDERQQLLRDCMCSMAQAFVEHMVNALPEEPALHAARFEAATLAEYL
jgi:hypothetical protein